MICWKTHRRERAFVSKDVTMKRNTLIAATYILMALEDDENSSFDVIESLMSTWPKPRPLLWMQICSGFEQMIAIHFEPCDYGILDQLLTVSKGLSLKCTPDYLITVNDVVGSVSQPNIMVKTALTRYDQISTSFLVIIDTPINRTHEYLRDCIIDQDDRHQNNDYYEHSTLRSE